MTADRPNNNNDQPQQFLFGLETLTQRLYDYVDTLSSSKRKTRGAVWLGIALVFIIVASLPLPDFLFWLSPIIGLPAGIILFAFILSLLRVTRAKDWKLVKIKEWAVPRKRVTYVIIGVILFATFLIFSSTWLPQGVGGALTIVVALSSYNIVRRTPYELELAAKGIPDPRDFQDTDDTTDWDEDEYDQFSSDYIDDDDDENYGLRRPN